MFSYLLAFNLHQSLLFKKEQHLPQYYPFISYFTEACDQLHIWGLSAKPGSSAARPWQPWKFRHFRFTKKMHTSSAWILQLAFGFLVSVKTHQSFQICTVYSPWQPFARASPNSDDWPAFCKTQDVVQLPFLSKTASQISIVIQCTFYAHYEIGTLHSYCAINERSANTFIARNFVALGWIPTSDVKNTLLNSFNIQKIIINRWSK